MPKLSIKENEKVICPACGNTRPMSEMRAGKSLPPNLQEQIVARHPNWDTSQQACDNCMREAKANFAKQILLDEHGHLSNLEQEVIDSFREGDIMPMNTNEEDIRERSLGEIYADRLADIVGSWRFSLGILLFLIFWIGFSVLSGIMVVNTMLVLGVISATLGSLAAIQGPIILMSQRRAAKRDRIRAENDFRVNLKAELEIHALNHKLDHIINLELDNIRRIEQLEEKTMQSFDEMS